MSGRNKWPPPFKRDRVEVTSDTYGAMLIQGLEEAVDHAAVERGSGNVFRDLGLSWPRLRLLRAHVRHLLRKAGLR